MSFNFYLLILLGSENKVYLLFLFYLDSLKLNIFNLVYLKSWLFRHMIYTGDKILGVNIYSVYCFYCLQSQQYQKANNLFPFCASVQTIMISAKLNEGYPILVGSWSYLPNWTRLVVLYIQLARTSCSLESFLLILEKDKHTK